MKKQIILAFLFVFALAIFTPAVAAVVTEQANVVAVNLDDNKKKETKTEAKKETKTEAKTEATKACCSSKAKSTCASKCAGETKKEEKK